MRHRVEKTIDLMSQKGVEAMLVMQPENRYYLSGFSGSTGALLITEKESYLCTDFRYTEQAESQSPHMEITRVRDTLPDTLAELQKKTGFNVLGYEDGFLNCKLYNKIQDRLPGVKMVPLSGTVERLRRIKDASELDIIEKAMSMLDLGFEYICGVVKPGMSEREIALELEFFLRRHGASGASFPFIVASGPRSSLPHGEASDRIIQKGDMLTIDFGVVYKHYNSDMTRTVAVGKKPPDMEEIYKIVLEAQLAALEAIKPGVPASEVDKAARSVIESKGYGEYFGHGTGHGVGLAVHEEPRLSSKDNTILEEGMVVTVEPGIYLPGRGGVRIEDSVVVESNGCRLLTKSPKSSLMEI